MLRIRSRGASTMRGMLAALLLAGGFACGGDSTGPGTPDSVDSVVITGAPTTTMLVGDSVRLVATAVNATGGVVSNQRISWTSSAPIVAAVRENGMLLALGAGSATITATASGHEGSVLLAIAFGVTMGTQGGVLTAAGGAFTLTLPPYALSQSTLLLVHPTSTAPADPRVVPGTAFELGPDGVVFSRGTLTLTYDPARIPAGLVAGSLQLYMQSGTGWVVVPGSTVDTVKKAVTGTITRAGVYAVRSTPVDRIVLSGSAAGGAVYVGQSAQLHATLYASTGDTLAAYAATWSSSDPGKATVDATGNVTGVAPGTATIKASSDGKSTQATVTVLARAIADWSRATDWTTYQGDARHSGYVDATLDPSVFREKWVATPSSAGAYYQPTVGGGRVYVSTNSYFGAQQLIALSLTDGSVDWVHDFGSIFGINQATYDNGTLWITTGGHEDTYIYALSETTGAMRFRTSFQSQWENWKAPIVVGSEIVTAGGYYGGMYGFDRQTGQQTFFMSGPQVDGWAPAALNGLVYATDYANGPGVRAVGPADGSIVADIPDSRLAAVTTPVIGGANDLFTIFGSKLVKVDLGTKQVAWVQTGSYTGMPVVGNDVVYGIDGGTIDARRESDGTLLWSWAPPQGTTPQTLALTHNLLFVGTAGPYGASGATFAVDLASHLAVWSYPFGGDFALSSQGVLFVASGRKVAAITVR